MLYYNSKILRLRQRSRIQHCSSFTSVDQIEVFNTDIENSYFTERQSVFRNS